MVTRRKTTRTTAADADAERETADALADASAEAEEKQLDETVPGGRYKSGDTVVNAEGEPLKK